jgi:hypothetical protein
MMGRTISLFLLGLVVFDLGRMSTFSPGVDSNYFGAHFVPFIMLLVFGSIVGICHEST